MPAAGVDTALGEPKLFKTGAPIENFASVDCGWPVVAM